MPFILDPTGTVRARRVVAARRPESLRGKVVGLLSNGVGATPEVLESLGTVLIERYGARAVVRRQRPSLSRPTPPEMIAELVQACDVIVAGCGL
jgi:hypothetical protein